MAAKEDESDNEKSSDEKLALVDKRLTTTRNAFLSEPSKNGADYYKAISNAIESLNYDRKSEDEPVTVIVYGSGLSDSGVLNFASEADKLLLHTPTEVLEGFKKTESNGSVKNLTIVWYGIGKTVTPQGELDTKTRDNLKDIYTGVLNYAFGVETKFEDTGNSGKLNPTKKTVKTAYTPELSCIFSYTEADTNLLEFKGSSKEFVDENRAAKELSRVADELIKCGSKSVEVKAYAAKYIDTTDEYMKSLSQDRAERIRKELLGRGVVANITAVGMGHGPFDDSGNSFQVNAPKNRIVTIKGIY